MAASFERNYSSEIDELVQYLNKNCNNRIGIKLGKIHPIMTKYVRDFNISDKYLHLSDMRKQIKKSPYLVSIDGKDTYKINVNNTSGMYTILDFDMLQEHGIDIDGFLKYLK